MSSVFLLLQESPFHILIFPILASWEFFALILRIICWILQTVKSLLINLTKKHIDNCFAPEIIRCSIFSQWIMSYLSPVDAKVAQCTWFTLDYSSPILCRSHHHRCHWHHDPHPCHHYRHLHRQHPHHDQHHLPNKWISWRALNILLIAPIRIGRGQQSGN